LGSPIASAHKHYIFGLLFFKRLSEVWEEYDQRIDQDRHAELAGKA
jgi:type I restriction enzyme M protein